MIWNDTDSFALDTDALGNVWVGISDGLSRYSPSPYPLPEVAPRVVISSIEGAASQWVAGDRPVLPFNQRSLLVRYTALSYASDARIRYRYRLLGYSAGMHNGISRLYESFGNCARFSLSQ